MHLYEDQFAKEHDFPSVTSPEKVLIIASTGRCGSHMLGHALHRTGRFGFPLEYVNRANLAEWMRRLETDDFEAVMSKIQRRRTSPNGVFGIKIHYPHIAQFQGFDNLKNFFPDAYYVLLSRSNVLKQAVSLAVASQNDVWISGQNPASEELKYDFELIDRCLRATILNNARWRYTLSANGCNYIEMDFDFVRKNLKPSIEQIAGFMGVELENADIPDAPVTQRQGDAINKQWEERYLADFDNDRNLLSDYDLSITDYLKRKTIKILRR